MYLAVGGMKRNGVKSQERSTRTSAVGAQSIGVGLTFLLRAEVLVGVPGSLLLLVFGERVSRSVRVLQCPLLTHGLLHLWTPAVTVGNWILRPVRRIRSHYHVRQMVAFD